MCALFLTDRYLFHLHTTYVDSSVSVRNYFDYAVKHTFELGFTEHIRLKPDYNTQEYIETIIKYKQITNVNALIGFEIGVKYDKVDIPPELLKMASVVVLSTHSKPNTFNTLYASYEATIEQIRGIKYNISIVWGHPGQFDMNSAQFKKMVRLFLDNDLYIEHSFKYTQPFPQIINNIPENSIIYGIDAHRLSDLKRHPQI